MFYYLYQVTNKVNGKIYVGVHKTKDLDDGYMGSGKVIQHAIKKYGAENFVKVILESFEDQEAMFAREKEIVDEEFLARSDTYNLRRGGQGGFDYINSLEVTKENRRLGGIKSSSNPLNPFKNPNWQAEHNLFIKNPEIQKLGNSSEARAKASKTMKDTAKKIGHQKGEKNSQFGKMWITDGMCNDKINKDSPIPSGWRKGRIL